MRSRHVFTFIAASAAAIAISSPAWQVPNEQSHDPGQPVRALSKTAKLSIVKAKFKLTSPPKGILDSLVLSANRPVVPNKGSLVFKGYKFYSNYDGPGYADYGAYGDSGHYSLQPTLTLRFYVAKPGKRHLVTFYVKPYSGVGNLRFEPNGFPAQTEDLTSVRDSKTAFVLITPTKTGSHYIIMKAPGGIRFDAVEIDVLD